MSVCSRTKWFWVRIPLLSLKLQIWSLLQARSSLTFRWTIECRFTLKLVLNTMITYNQYHSCLLFFSGSGLRTDSVTRITWFTWQTASIFKQNFYLTWSLFLNESILITYANMLILLIALMILILIMLITIHWLDRLIVRKQLDIMPTYHYVQNQGKLMVQVEKMVKNLNSGIFLTISRPNISKLQFFLKNRFHSNWRLYLVLTSGQSRFWEKYKSVWLWANFANISKSRIFFRLCDFSTFIVP